jgi:hypothetical protein
MQVGIETQARLMQIPRDRGEPGCGGFPTAMNLRKL